MKVQKTKRNTVIVILGLLVFCIASVAWIKLKDFKEEQPNSDVEVLEAMMVVPEKPYTEQEKKEKVDAYISKLIEDQLSQMDWTGREDEKEIFRQILLEGSNNSE